MPTCSRQHRWRFTNRPVCARVMVADKQLVEMIHANAINVLRGCQQSSVRYQSVTLILRGKCVCHVMIARDTQHLFSRRLVRP